MAPEGRTTCVICPHVDRVDYFYCVLIQAPWPKAAPAGISAQISISILNLNLYLYLHMCVYIYTRIYTTSRDKIARAAAPPARHRTLGSPIRDLRSLNLTWRVHRRIPGPQKYVIQLACWSVVGGFGPLFYVPVGSGRCNSNSPDALNVNHKVVDSPLLKPQPRCKRFKPRRAPGPTAHQPSLLLRGS